MKTSRIALILLFISVNALGSQQKQDSVAPQAPQTTQNTTSPTDKSEAYYHYAMARALEEKATSPGTANPQTIMSQAVDEMKLAVQSDPASSALQVTLAELYARNNRIRDGIVTLTAVIEKDKDNLDAHKLLGRIYLHTMGDPNGSSGSRELLRLAITEFEQVDRLEPKDFENPLLLGRLYLLNHDLLKAEAALKRTLAIQPSVEEAVLSLASAYNEMGEPAKAKSTLDSLPEKSRSPKYYSTLGEFYEQQHDNRAAAGAWKKAYALESDNTEYQRRWASALSDSGQNEEALKVYVAMTTADPRNGAALLRMCELQRRMGKLDDALKTVQKLEIVSPNLVEAKYNKALILAGLGKYDEAIPAMQKLVEQTAPNGVKDTAAATANHAMFLEKLGSMYRETGKTQLAVETFHRMTLLDDESAVRGYQEQVETLRTAKQFSAAAAVVEEAVAKFPNERDLKITLATQQADAGQVDKAVATVKSMLKGSGANRTEERNVYLALAQVYERVKKWPESEEALTEAEKLSNSPEEQEYTTFWRGTIYERQKKYDAAEEMFRKVLTINPKNSMTLNYLGYMLADRGVRLDEALGFIQQAVSMDPQNAEFLDSLGWVYFRQGKYELAEDNLRRALAKSVNDATMHDHIAELYLKTGRVKMAAAHWERAIEEWNKSLPGDVDPNDVARVQKKLESAKVKIAKDNTDVKR
jgi:tetratricopeptide (TPR) repeat protein